MTQHDDLPYLGQMLDAAEEASAYIAEMSFDDFAADRMRQRAVIYVVQIIGEAARQVSAPGRLLYNEIPWPQIIGMRHKLVHDYLGVDVREVWRTADVDLPLLIDALQRALTKD